MRRRRLLSLPLATGFAQAMARTIEPFDQPRPDQPLRFPLDHGAHPAFRIEWWYLTGWLDPHGTVDQQDRAIGFQITFFRSRTAQARENNSRFSPAQLLFAHAGVSRPSLGRLQHDQRAARAGFGLASADPRDTAVVIGDWSLRRTPDDLYLARIPAEGFLLDLRLRPPHPPVLQGAQGFSRKGPDDNQASHYYSRPHMQVDGRLRTRGTADVPVGGTAWLDHEWSSEQLHPDASGWDWVGLALDDGSALMAFEIRRRGGGTLWRHARWIDRDGQPAPQAAEPVFAARRWWTSPHTRTRYPVEITLRVGLRTMLLEPLIDDQELDSRASTGVLYWEGAVRVLEDGRPVGRGYLELTGYGSAVRY